jgi:uncharacterized membrane protein YfcA
MKRFLALLLAVVMMFTLCACGKTAPKDDTADKGGNTTTAGVGIPDGFIFPGLGVQLFPYCHYSTPPFAK